MDDAMLDLMADQGGLRRRLDAYAEARLSPDLVATTRMRSRVLAVAHRQSALARADATLALIADPTHLPAVRRTARLRRRMPAAARRAATVLLAAGLAVASVSTVALGAQPGNALYGARVWAEELTLPSDPRARALAELDRLETRLVEIREATLRGDGAALGAALAAYQHIVEQATADVLAADDEIAAVVLEEGVANHIEVLSALVTRLPEGGSEAVGRALERAIDRSTDAVESIKPGNGNDGGGSEPGGNDHGTGDPGGPSGTSEPTATDAPDATARPKPTKEPKPTATAKPAATAEPDPTERPQPSDRPQRTPPPPPATGGENDADEGGSPGSGERPPRPTPERPGD